MIGVILPSRGLIFAEAMDSFEKNLEMYNHRFYISWDKKIPDCQNTLVERALADNCEYLLFVEEDTVMPDGAISRMLMKNSDIVAIDYGVAGYSCITKDKKTNEILWCGLGCTLVNAEVFKTLPKPYFRSDKQLLLNNWPEEQWIDAPHGNYGGQDIYFCVQARKAGYKIDQAEGECKHLRLEALGTPEDNHGLHKIEQKPIISKHQTLPL